MSIWVVHVFRVVCLMQVTFQRWVWWRVGGVCEMCMARGVVWVGEWMRTGESGTGVCLVAVGSRWGVLSQKLGGWVGVMSGCVVIMDSLCRWQIQVSIYCVWRIPAHLRWTQWSVLLHLMLSTHSLINIGFLPYICLWRISQIQTCLRVVVGLD